jgi:hypothetical protein
MRDFFGIPFPGDIKIAVAASELFDIRGTVDTGTVNVLVVLPVSGGQSAGTGHVPVTLLVEKQGFQQFKDSLLVLVEKISLGFLSLSKHLIEFF